MNYAKILLSGVALSVLATAPAVAGPAVAGQLPQWHLKALKSPNVHNFRSKAASQFFKTDIHNRRPAGQTVTSSIFTTVTSSVLYMNPVLLYAFAWTKGCADEPNQSLTITPKTNSFHKAKPYSIRATTSSCGNILTYYGPLYTLITHSTGVDTFVGKLVATTSSGYNLKANLNNNISIEP